MSHNINIYTLYIMNAILIDNDGCLSSPSVPILLTSLKREPSPQHSFSGDKKSFSQKLDRNNPQSL